MKSAPPPILRWFARTLEFYYDIDVGQYKAGFIVKMSFGNHIPPTFPCALFLSLLTTGCSTATHSIDFSKSELQLIPTSSLKRMASNHSADETVVVRVGGYGAPLVVKEFNNRDTATVFDADGKEVGIPFADITELLISKKPKVPNQTESYQKSGTKAASSGVGEALIYAPLIPVALVTWPLASGMGLDESKNEMDREKARRIYQGMSRNDLLGSIGPPIEKYSCFLKFNRNEKQGVADEVWVYDERKVLRGGRALFINIDKGAVYQTSHHTSFFKQSDTFDCSTLVTP